MKNALAFGFTSVITIVLLTNTSKAYGLAVSNVLNVLHNNNGALLSVAKDGSTREFPNRSKRYVLQSSRWRVKNLTYKISNYPKGLKKTDVDAEISRAFKVWSEHSSLNFKAKSNGSVHIEISFVDAENGDPFDGPGKVVSRSYFPISGGDIYFDNAEHWTIGESRGINLFQAATHEIGHSLGLQHSKNKSAIMGHKYRGFNPEFKLDEDDISGIQALYGKKPVKRKPLKKNVLVKKPKKL